MGMIFVACLLLLGVGVAGGGLWLLTQICTEYRDELGEILPLFVCVALLALLGSLALLAHHLLG